ncbi:ABC transporter permease [Granulicoccus sp. GXG6511]|uniref:ABC transporter permease n=1 Tax=Granulicoccus sp. GXG6511 TaxID=3381351 RepID=UPI003D7CD5AD
MLRLILVRLGTAVLTVWLASLFVFVAVQLLPGDVAQQILGQDATPEAVAAMRESLGLNRPVFERYVDWLGGMLTGDMGTSLVSGEPVADTLLLHARNTLLIAIPTIILGITLSVVLGLLAGLYRGRGTDRTISGLALVGMSVPEFVTATVLVLLFAIAIPIFPAVVIDGAEARVSELIPFSVLPVIVLTISMAAYIIRMTRAGVIDALASEFVTTAQLKGVRPGRVVLRHALPSAILPTLNVIAINIAWLIGGVVVVEAVFNYPGMGTLMIESVHNRDLPVIQAIAVLSASVYALTNLGADLVAMGLDPRQRSGRFH